MKRGDEWREAVREQLERNAQLNLLQKELGGAILLPNAFCRALESFRRSSPVVAGGATC